MAYLNVYAVLGQGIFDISIKVPQKPNNSVIAHIIGSAT